MTDRDLRQYFNSILRSGKVSHAYIIEGAATSQAVPAAVDFAAALQGRAVHPDIITVTHEKPAVISVDEIRRQVVDDIVIKPYEGPYKIYLIPDADLMNTAAQNALLKTLEEPPEYGVIMLFTAGTGEMLETISSRAVTLKLQRDGEADTDPGLREEIADILLEVPGSSVAQRGACVKTLTALCRDRGVSVQQILPVMQGLVRDMLVISCKGPTESLGMPERSAELAEEAGRYTPDRLIAISDAIILTGQELKSNVNAELSLEKLLLEL